MTDYLFQKGLYFFSFHYYQNVCRLLWNTIHVSLILSLILCKTCMNDMAELLRAYTCSTKSNLEVYLYRVKDMM